MLAVVADRLVIVGPIATVNETPLLACPLTVTTMLPVLAPLGPVATMDVALQLVAVALVPLNVTVLVPCVEPKFVPVIVTDVPTAPEVCDSPLMFGVGSTVKLTPLLGTPLTVTTTLPVLAPLGTVATMDVALQLVAVALVPLNVTVLVPCVEPKFVPVIVTDVPTAPEVGDSPLMFGLGNTAKLTPLLFTPLAWTTTAPVVAPDGTEATIDVELQLVTVANVPLKVTVLEPCVLPKFAPEIVKDAPTGPELGDRLVMLGAGTTVNETPLLLTPLACTTTFPVVAPEGTGVTIELALQVVGVADVPLKLTVLAPCVEPKLLPPIVTEAPTAPVVGDTLLILRRRYYCERNSVTRDIVHRN